MTPHRKRASILLLPIASLAALYVGAQDYFEAAAFVVRAAGMQGTLRTLAGLESEEVTQSPVVIPWRGGELRGRSYVPHDVSGRRILLVPGVHAAGIDEPRLVNFAMEMAATGHPVTTAELPDLVRYEITPRTTDMIEDAARWLADTRADEGDAAVGLMGISFAGGLSIVAAARLGEQAAWVLSFGGHGDLPRTLRYLCTGIGPRGLDRPPHDYGVVIILLGVADRLVPADQAEPLRAAVRVFLNASHLDMVDKERASKEFARARALGAQLPEPARTFMRWVNERDVAQLGPALLPHTAAMGRDPSLSAERNAPPRAPVYLLHGAHDNVIPAAESLVLAEYLRLQGAEVVLLATPLITHAEVDRPPAVGEMWKLIRFWAAPL
jgi:pimeloyl-ACP methyl ester carboxylesterase